MHLMIMIIIGIIGHGVCIPMGVIVPLYTDLTTSLLPNEIINVHRQYPDVPIIVINSFDNLNASLPAIINMTSAGIPMIYYTWSDFGAVNVSTLKHTIDVASNYNAIYGHIVSGIFFDETPTDVKYVPYYQELSKYVHNVIPNSITVANTWDLSTMFIGSMDVFCMHEAYLIPPLSEIRDWSYPANSVYIIAHNVTTIDINLLRSLSGYVNWLYISDADANGITDTYDYLPAYFSKYISVLNMINHEHAETASSAVRLVPMLKLNI